MRIDITSLCFGFKISKDNDSGTPAWATSIAQAPKDICYIQEGREGLNNILYGMMFTAHSDFENLKVRGVTGLDSNEEPHGDRERMMFSVFEKVYVNGLKVDGIYTLAYEKENTPSHKNRKHICYAKYLTYKGHSNKATLLQMAKVLECSNSACWFVYDISIKHQSELHFSAVVVNAENSMVYESSKARKQLWDNMLLETLDGANSTTNGKAQSLNPTWKQQVIFYGAPGTGKSHEINRIIKNSKNSSIRTTFHPDSDYSTFVGAYKPTMERIRKCVVIDKEEKAIKSSVTNSDFDTKITYKFVKQAFLKAYLGAWQKYVENSENPEPQFLVIEELNRGNCAQIFGDIFQLLDRDEKGFSSYPIEADSDLQMAIADAFSESGEYKLSDRLDADILIEDYVSNYGQTLSEDIIEGRILLLPCNLYIWATMNTSDQSLFPIDSAFKRRWDWQYVPISDAGKQWVIRVNGKDYNWWSFLEKINQHIYKATYSEDKKLGYFFCKANSDGVIDADKFVSKVVFYLWNDVFKDTEFEGDAFKDGDNGKLSFDKFYIVKGNKTEVVSEKVEQFLQNLGLSPIVETDSEEDDEEEDADESLTSTKKMVVTFDDGTIIEGATQFDTYLEAIKKIGVEKIYPIAAQMKYKRKGCALVDNEQRDAILNSNFVYVQVDGYYVVKRVMLKTMVQALNHWTQELGINIKIEEK